MISMSIQERKWVGSAERVVREVVSVELVVGLGVG